MEYLMVAVILGGFGYFIYTRVQKANERKNSVGSGSGSDGPDTQEH